MERNLLLESANKISKVSDNSIKEYVDKMDILNAKMNESMLGRKDIFELIGGEKNIRTMKDIHYNNLHFVASILQTPNTETLVDTTLWEFRAYMSRGFVSNYWAAQISTWIQLLKENISEKAFNEILSIYNWYSVNIPQFTIEAEGKLKEIEFVENV